MGPVETVAEPLEVPGVGVQANMDEEENVVRVPENIEMKFAQALEMMEELFSDVAEVKQQIRTLQSKQNGPSYKLEPRPPKIDRALPAVPLPNEQVQPIIAQ